MTKFIKYALVTGSTKGIGKEIAFDLLRKGYFVFFNYSCDDSIIEELENEIILISSEFVIIKCDLAKQDSYLAFVEAIRSITQNLDVVVFNMAITNRKDFFSIRQDEWNDVITANLSIPFFILQAIGKSINTGGNIIFIGALLGIVPHALSISYGVSKAGLHMLSKYLVKVFAEQEITVNTIAPGFIETPWQNDKPDDIRSNIEKKIALHRFGTVQEVSKVCMLLLDNRYINGQVIVVDGGYCYE